MIKMAALCVTEEQCKAWEKTGKTEFLKVCKSLVSDKKHAVEGTEEMDFKRALYELCWHAVRHNLKLDSAVHVISELIERYPDVPSLLADTFGIMDIEIMCSDEKELRENFSTFIQHCYTLVPESLIKERLDLDTLENMGILASKQNFNNKYVKTKTKLFYKQQKFNLLREESEGYSKLVTELHQDLNDADLSALDLIETIKSLIGCFNLDPNRVLDIILEAFECRPEQEAVFVPLLQTYIEERDTICHVLGFKFHFYQQTQDSDTPVSLYQVAALLLKHKLVDLETLYPHLSPLDGDIVEKHKRGMADAKAYVKKLSVVVLSDKEKEKDDKEPKIDQYHNNQKLGLCRAAVEIGDWECAKLIIERMPPWWAMSYRPLADSLCRLINYMLEPLYVKESGLPDIILRKRKKRAPAGGTNFGNTHQVSTFTACLKEVFPKLCYVGPNLSRDTVLFGKILRLARNFMKETALSSADHEAVLHGFLTVFNEVILPSLSLIPCNCCLAEEVWGFMRQLHYQHRYRLYGQWKNESHLAHPQLICVRADVTDRAKYIMKRLAKENVKPLGRQIGKLSHSNPGVLFELILSQIQKYDNFIGPVVDSLKFLTPLSYDILSYCIIEALANPSRERLKHDDTNISLWLQSLANFSGTVFKKYQIDLAGLLQYVANTLKGGLSYDLLILREVVQRMAGIEVSEEITDDQLDCMSGGELLKQEGGYFSQVRNTKKSSNRLKESLLEQQLAIPMCLLMAQQRHRIIFPANADTSDRRHIKLIGKLYDQCQDTLVQFISFLSLQLSGEEFTKRLPPIDELTGTYHIHPDATFALWRIILANNITSKFDELRKQDRKDKDKTNSQSAKVQRYVEASECVMKPVNEMVMSNCLPRSNEEISMQFYTTFWSLTIADLQVPTASYERQIQQLKSQISGIEDNKDLNSSKKKKEKERCVTLIEKLTEEERRQQEHVKLVMGRLKQEKDVWFTNKKMQHATITSIIQLCLFPRSCFTTVDAVYCARFLYTMHNLKTQNFSSLICYDRIFTEMMWAMTSCTESEANRFGRFLCAVLDDLMRWHSDKSFYEKECASYPGFITVFRKPCHNTQAVPDCLDYENYRQVVHKWHFTLAKLAVQTMESGDYIQIRNIVIVLTKIVKHFPRLSRYGHAVERRVDRVCVDEKEKRPDLYALAMGYSGQLKQRKRTWVQDAEFRRKEDTNTKGGAAKSPASKENSKDVPDKEKPSATPAPTSKSSSKTSSKAPKVNGEASATDKEKEKEKRESKSTSSKPDKSATKRSSQTDKDKERREVKVAKTDKDSKTSSPSTNREGRSKTDDSKRDKESASKTQIEKDKASSRSKTKDKDKCEKEKEKIEKVKSTDKVKDSKVKDKEIKEKSKGEKKTSKDKEKKEEKGEKGGREDKDARKEKEVMRQSSQEADGEMRHKERTGEKEKASRDKERIKESGEKEKTHSKERGEIQGERERDDYRETREVYAENYRERERGSRNDHYDHYEHNDTDQSGSRESSHASHRRSADTSPKSAYDLGDVKRRKVEIGSSSKDSLGQHGEHRDKLYKSPAYDRADMREVDWADRGERVERGGDRDKERKERKRERSDDRDFIENKRYKSQPSAEDTPPKTSKLNGDKVKEKHQSRSVERDTSRSRDKETKLQKSSRKESPSRDRSADKRSSKKLSKHH